MHDDTRVALDHHELQALDNVLDDAGTSKRTRSWLLKRAGVGVAAAGAMGTFGPVSSALASSKKRTLGESAQDTINIASTLETFGTLFADQVIKRSPGTPSGTEPLITVIKALGAAEYDHYAGLIKLGAKPLTTRIWIPDALYGDGGTALFKNVELAETLEVNAYLIGVTNLGNAGMADNARYAAEILGVESEHRTLARTAQGLIGGFQHVPNNFGLEQFIPHDLSEILAAFEAVGVGFGTQGATPGAFYDFDGTEPATFSTIDGNTPN